MKRKRRKVLAAFGFRPGERVTVREDRLRGLVTVHMPGRAKQSWPLTDEGRGEAVAFAEGFFARRREMGAAAQALDLTALWALYADSERPRLRVTTWTGYARKWRRFVLFAGSHKPALEVGPMVLVDYAKALRGLGIAANQIRNHIGMVKIVYAWARNHELLPSNPVAGWRFKSHADEKKHAPAEYQREDFEAVLRQFDPWREWTWRAWAVWMLVGHQGVRINAALHLRWSDIRDGYFNWPAEFDKKHRDWRQPIRDGALSALCWAEAWRARKGYAGPWVFFPARKRREGRPWTVQAFWRHLRLAEERAGVPHLELRAFHGLRRMVVGDVLRETGDLALAMQFVGDRDLSQAPSYVKDRMDRFEDAAERLDAADSTRIAPDEKVADVSA